MAQRFRYTFIFTLPPNSDEALEALQEEMTKLYGGVTIVKGTGAWRVGADTENFNGYSHLPILLEDSILLWVSAIDAPTVVLPKVKFIFQTFKETYKFPMEWIHTEVQKITAYHFQI